MPKNNPNIDPQTHKMLEYLHREGLSQKAQDDKARQDKKDKSKPVKRKHGV